MPKENNPIAGVRAIPTTPDYPSAYPTAEMELIAESIADPKSHDKTSVQKAAWTTIGYCIAPTFEIKKHFLASIPKPADHKEAARHVQECAQAHVIPTWLLPVLVQILQTILENVLKGSSPPAVEAPAAGPETKK